MPFNDSSSAARDGDIAELVGLRHKHFIITLKSGAKFETHRGVLLHDDLIGKPGGPRSSATWARRSSCCSHPWPIY